MGFSESQTEGVSRENTTAMKTISSNSRVTFVLQYFHPEFASTAELMTELAEGLVTQGMDVHVITGQPSYLRSGKLSRKQIYKGIRIERLPSSQFDKNSALGRMSNWLSFTFWAFLRLLSLKRDRKLFIVSQPPFLFVVGWLLSVLRKQEYICLVYDLYPEIAVGLGVLKENGIVARIWDRANRVFFEEAQYVIVPGESMRTLIAGKVKQGDKVKLIHNWADGNYIKPIEKRDNWFCQKYDLAGKLVVMYSGNIGLFHSLEILVEAASQLRDNNEIEFVFIGEGGKKNKLMSMVNQKQLDNVLFLPYQDNKTLPYSLTSADFSVVSLEKGLDCVAAPCKLYTSLASGSAILGITDSTCEVAQIIDKYECGFNIRHDDVSTLVADLERISGNEQVLNRMKENSRRCFIGNFQREPMIEKYYGLLQD